MDSLRYWVLEMHVDGFRFDLASALARELHRRRQARRVLRHHPPGSGHLAGQADRRALGSRRRRLPGRQLPGPVDRVERPLPRHRAALLARRSAGSVSEMATRLAGSADLYEHSGRRPYASINFVTSHDGFTLHDLVELRRSKHNEANGDDNQRRRRPQPELELRRRGADRRSGGQRAARAAEAQPPRDAASVAGRADARAAATSSGDTQQGNNNAYCQDNEISWIDWDLDERGRAFLDFVRRMVRLRAANRCCAAALLAWAAAIRGSDIKDITWFTPGRPRDRWKPTGNARFARSLGVRRVFDDPVGPDPDQAVEPNTMMLLFNADVTPITVPAAGAGRGRALGPADRHSRRGRPRVVGCAARSATTCATAPWSSCAKRTPPKKEDG